jgi:hypothetical protein
MFRLANVFFLFTIVLVFGAIAHTQTTSWDFETATLEGWYPDYGDPTLSVQQPGHDSDYAMGVSGAQYCRIRFDGPTVEGIELTGTTGGFLPMLYGADLYLEMDTFIPSGHSVYLDIYIYGEEYRSRWISYPYDGYGSTEDLGDGWFRHHFANHHVGAYEPPEYPPPPIPYMTMQWNGFPPSMDRIDNWMIITPGATGTDDPILAGSRNALFPSSPNPFNPATTLGFEIREAGPVTLSVYSLDGRKVADLLQRSLSAGSHRISWNGCDDRGRAVSSGVYIYRLQAGDFVDTRRMSLAR